MRVFPGLATAAVLALAGCGDGSVKSPGFSGELHHVEVSPATATVAAGGTVDLDAAAYYSRQPGEEGFDVDEEPDAEWSVDEPDIASVDEDGVVTGLRQGTAEVSARVGGVEGTAVVTVSSPVLLELVFEPAEVEVPVGAEQDVQALGVYTGSDTPRELTDGTEVNWLSNNPLRATVDPNLGNPTTVTGVSVGATSLRATAINEEGETISGVVPVTVSDAALTAVVALEPEEATIKVGLQQQFTAIGQYSDGSTAEIPDAQLDWRSSDETIASIDAGGLASGLAEGEVTITAELQAAVQPGIPDEDRSATATLAVGATSCTSQLLASNGATVTTEVAPNALLCLGCLVDDEVNVIDDVDDNFARMIVPVALLGGNVSLTVTAAEGTQFEPGAVPGFVIARPANMLLSAELLSQLTVTTFNDGQEVESSSEFNPLRLTLLGLLDDEEQALITLSEAASEPFDALRLRFTSALLTALATVDVYAACASTAQIEE